MSTRSGDPTTEYDTAGVEARPWSRYAHTTLEDGDTLVYDRESEDAWIQAEVAIGLDTIM